ncbi:helix-turn-helix domain-containing protein [Vibrio sp. SCSIO 43132]|uniref:helix-turn-helix domain-containing protein n=1 Tax=Vibrio sp. SCSIO 43132 TaxID=2779363 RepID=UPI001CA9BA99|nr:helix-turn-helix transcriptional regulator [Vibrio sp. SCSIO 43132]UAB72684.1 helix-turn-helix domain-containing protein [Vibrio sp. SCSIO 43132]
MTEFGEKSYSERLGELFKNYRILRGLTQADVALKAFGQESRSSDISKYERALVKSVQPRVIRDICDALAIPEDERIKILPNSSREVPSKKQSVQISNADTPIVLDSRTQFVNRAYDLLGQSSSFRALITGPFFCHPDVYFKQKSKKLHYPDFDFRLKEFILSHKERNHSIKIMLSNSKRYEEKVFGYIDKEIRKEFFSECIREVDKIWGVDRDQGPDLCCSYVGHYHIPYIFDDTSLIQYRSKHNSPTRGATEYNDAAFVKAEKSRFDSIFCDESKGQYEEVEMLISHFKKLMEG